MTPEEHRRLGVELYNGTWELIERQDRDIDLSMKDLVRTASTHRRRSSEDLCDRLVELLAGVELFDDATLLVVRREGEGEGLAGRPAGV